MARIQIFAALGLAALTAGCSAIPGAGTGIVSRPAVKASEPVAPETGAYVTPPAGTTASGTGPLQGGGQSVAQLDTTTAAEKAAAAAPAASTGGKLGTTVASLGDATEAGFWIKTPLVSAPAKGRVVNPENGKSANVSLTPLGGGGSGSQISLAVMQQLGVSLTDLPSVEVWRD